MNDTPAALPEYFAAKLKEHGPTARGVDWGSEERQSICFRQLFRILQHPLGKPSREVPSFLDYGCGYGALAGWMRDNAIASSRYQGFDFTPGMIDHARELFGSIDNATFTDSEAEVQPADFVLGSGLLALKLGRSVEEWEPYVFELLQKLWSLSRRGLAFNSLTSYSDADRMRPDLYYPDPMRLFDFCKRHLSRNVSVLHDYGLYEFTILVRRDEEVSS